MVYTYDNILEEARKAGVLEKFSQEDHTAAQKNPEYGMSMVGLLKDANNATTETQRLLATETLNQLRKSYGVTGAAGTPSVSSFTGAQRLAAPERTGTLASSDPTTYQAILDDIVNQREFTYEPENDPTYKAYESKYLREGRRATENMLAQLAAMTGGRPSSYAISAAQQAGNEYAAALADIIPTLRQNALTEHQQDIAAKYDILGALETKRQAEYQKVLDEENRKRLEVQDALNKYRTLGYVTPDVAQILGIPEGTKLGEVPKTGAETYSTIIPIGGALNTMLNGTNNYDPAKEALKNAGQVNSGLLGIGTGIRNALSENMSTGGINNNGASGSGNPMIANPMGGIGKDSWIQVGNDRISLEDLEQEMLAGRIVGKYDASSNTVSYERIPTQGMSQPAIGKGKIHLTMNANV